VELAIPKLPRQLLSGQLFTYRRRAEQALVSVVATSYLLRVSTPPVEKLVDQLGVAQLQGRTWSAGHQTWTKTALAPRLKPVGDGPCRPDQPPAQNA
jgi:transposase-like protein